MINTLQAALYMEKQKVGEIFHVHVSLPPDIVIITTYEPDLEEWINYKIRR